MTKILKSGSSKLGKKLVIVNFLMADILDRLYLICYNGKMIDQASIENLKNTLDIVDVIANYIELKKAGANYKANCPFHGEKSASFIVSPQKQIYHCFGCGVGGDSIKFVMEYEKLSYKDAIEKIATTFNFHLNYTKESSDTNQSKKVLESIEQWYQKNLTNTSSALEYIKTRGITQNSIETFGIGYVPQSGEVVKFLDSILVPFSLSEEIGVLSKGEGGIYARLTERITFPIYNQSGAIVGFGGRTITDHPAKYINSPQTKLFNKSKLLYGYNIAKESIYANKKIIICEGYLDVIMLHQGGFKEAVATLGTALTKEHLPLLRKGEPKITLAYDGDKAGVAAAIKAATMLSQGGFDGGVVIFPDGLDPADMVVDGKISQLSKLFRDQKSFSEFVIQSIASSYNLSDPKAKESAFEAIKSYLFGLSEILRDAYLPFAASALNLPKSLFLKGVKKDKTGILLQKKEDMEILCMLKTFIEDAEAFDDVKKFIHSNMFGEYSAYFEEIANRNQDSELFRSVELNSDIKTINKEDIKRSVLKFLINYYKNYKVRVMANKEVSFGKKVMANKVITAVIVRLKNGEFVEYESVSTI